MLGERKGDCLRLCDGMRRRGADIRYATTMESLRSMASSATALVRSTVSRTEFIWRRRGSKGDSRSTGAKKGQYIVLLNYLVSPALFMFLHPVLSKLLSASDSG